MAVFKPPHEHVGVILFAGVPAQSYFIFNRSNIQTALDVKLSRRSVHLIHARLQAAAGLRSDRSRLPARIANQVKPSACRSGIFAAEPDRRASFLAGFLRVYGASACQAGSRKQPWLCASDDCDAATVRSVGNQPGRDSRPGRIPNTWTFA